MSLFWLTIFLAGNFTEQDRQKKPMKRIKKKSFDMTLFILVGSFPWQAHIKR